MPALGLNPTLAAAGCSRRCRASKQWQPWPAWPAPQRSRRQRWAARAAADHGSGSGGSGQPPPKTQPLQRSLWFVQQGNPKEAWLSLSATVLQVTLPASLLALALHGTLWGSSAPTVVAAAEATAVAGALVAGGSEVWKILEGFRG